MIKIILLSLSILFVSGNSYALNADVIYQQTNHAIFAVYGIDAASNTIKMQGSAVAVAPNILATNCHVALSGNFLQVKTPQGNKRAAIIYHDSDICLLEVAGMNFTSVTIRPSKDVKIGEEVFAIGNPRGLEKTFSKGIISNEHIIRNLRLLQTDAAIAPGSSGGALFDSNGKLIGITTMMLRNAQNVNFALPTELISQYFNTKSTVTPATATQIKVTFVNLGTFGSNQLQLYQAKYNNKSFCFMYIPGRDSSSKIISALIWEPKNPNAALIFPWVFSTDQVLATLARIPQQKANINMQLDNALSRDWGHLSTSTPPYKKITFSNKNPQDIFLQRKSMTLNLQNQQQIIPVNFNFLGLEEALLSYQNHCLK